MTLSPNRFNLIDEAWIPIAAGNRVSLMDVFTRSDLPALGGNAVQKMALLKLLQAIAQAACTPQDDAQWRELGSDGLALRCAAYLTQWHGRFYLYGDKPFLQMPAISVAAIQPYGAVLPEVASGNTTVLIQTQQTPALVDSDKAILLMQLMGFALGGKKTDNSVVLTPGYTGKFNDKGKSSTGKAGPSLSHLGFLHCVLLGETLQQTIWLNLFTQQDIKDKAMFSQGVGTPPWESMPLGEACGQANLLQHSLMGRLLPLSRFVLLKENGLHYSEGIQHLDYKAGMHDPSVAVDMSAKKPRALWTNPDKRPWRELGGLLAFLAQQKTKDFDCWQMQVGISRVHGAVNSFAVWCGGLRVSSNAGEQYVSGTDDMVESQIWLESAVLNEMWFSSLQQELTTMENQAKKLYACTMAYFKHQKNEGDAAAGQATALYWNQCEQEFPFLLNACGASEEDVAKRETWHKKSTGLVQSIYNRMCPNNTPRQMEAWAKHRPR